MKRFGKILFVAVAVSIIVAGLFLIRPVEAADNDDNVDAVIRSGSYVGSYSGSIGSIYGVYVENRIDFLNYLLYLKNKLEYEHGKIDEVLVVSFTDGFGFTHRISYRRIEDVPAQSVACPFGMFWFEELPNGGSMVHDINECMIIKYEEK